MSDRMVDGLVLASICFIGYSIFHYATALIRERQRLNRFIEAEERMWKWKRESRSEINRMLREIERVKR